MRAFLRTLLIFTLFFSGLKAEASGTLNTSDFSHLQGQELQTQLVSFLYHFKNLNDLQKSRLAEALTLKIFSLHPHADYELTLKALRDNYPKAPEGSEYLARLLHTTWLARYGSEALSQLSQAELDQAGTIGMMGLVLTAAASWKQPGQWARYARLARDLFVPVGAAAAVIQVQKGSNGSSAPAAPMIYFDFPIPSEQGDELVERAYQELMVDLSSWGAATGLTRFLLTSKNVIGLASEGAAFGGRILKPLLLVAVLSYGIGEVTGFLAHESRYNTLLNEWADAKQSMESSLKNDPRSSLAQVDSFLQTSRRMSFFMFYPILKMQNEADTEVFNFASGIETALEERSRSMAELIEILKAVERGEDFRKSQAFEAADFRTQALAEQIFDEIQFAVFREGHASTQEAAFRAALSKQATSKIEYVQGLLTDAPTQAAETLERQQNQVYENLKRNLQHELLTQNGSSCQYDFEKYEFVNYQQQGAEFSSPRWSRFVSLASWQDFRFQQSSTFDQWLKSINLQQGPPASVNSQQEIDFLKEKWQGEWNARNLCRHSPLFLTQTYEYLQGLGTPAVNEAAHQSLELLVAQKILIQSILGN